MPGTTWTLRSQNQPDTPTPSELKVPVSQRPPSTGESLRSDALAVAYEPLLKKVHNRLINEIDKSLLAVADPQRARTMIESAARSLISAEDSRILPQIRDAMAVMVADDVLGLGPIEPLYRDKSISEIMVNGPDRVYIEKEGRLYKVPIRFRDNDHIMQIVDRIVSPLGRRIDEASPMVDARLPDGSRVNAIIPPLSPKSPSITIRKFRTDRLQIADLIKANSLTQGMSDFLAACVKLRLNIIIAGGTGSGKTTMLNALSAVIPEDERIVTIEDPAELQLKQEHVVTLEARPAGIEGRDAVTQRDLVRNSLRMRPDRIIVGEVRGSEAFDMLQAMNTGHDGSISTVHANTPRDAVARIENMVMMAGFELPARAIREQISSAIHLIVQLNRFRDGTRRITHVTEIAGMEGETVTMQDIFLFEQKSVDANGKILGAWRPTGLRPTFADRFASEGIAIPNEIFQTSWW